jgi:NADPH2:quinone reductase
VKLGAEAAINYRTEDFAARIASLTEGRGVDVVIDLVGAPYFECNMKCLAMDRRLVDVYSIWARERRGTGSGRVPGAESAVTRCIFRGCPGDRREPGMASASLQGRIHGVSPGQSRKMERVANAR